MGLQSPCFKTSGYPAPSPVNSSYRHVGFARFSVDNTPSFLGACHVRGGKEVESGQRARVTQ